MKTIILIIVSLLLASMVYADGQINIAYSPYTISKPGSYIVVKDLTTALDLDCIDINTSNVIIDLNGHTLYGAGIFAGPTGTGIRDVANGGANNVTLYNGTIQNCRVNGIELLGVNARVEHVNVYDNGQYGIHLGGNGLVADCNVSNNGYIGIRLDGNKGGIIRNNQVSYNQSDGIYGSDATILNNYSFNNQGNGINAAYCLVENNTVDTNLSNGISVSKSRVIGNYCLQQNAPGAGILAQYYNTIENNTLYANSTGVFTTSTNNYIAGNRLTNNTVSIFTTVGNSLGDGTTGFFNKIY